MSTTHSLYDTPTREIYLLENVGIQGRKTELRQLLKLLNLAKTGQPKAALITGDAGIGKTALLETFTDLVREGVYCRILNLGNMDYATPEAIYIAIIEKLQEEANDILNEALVAANEITRDLDLHWERPDLLRNIALVSLQSISSKEPLSQEQLVKAIRSQVPAVKKLKFSVNDSIEKLVDLIVNPWVMVATSLLNPINPTLKEAIRLASVLKDGEVPQPAASNGNGAGAETRPYSPPVQSMPERPPLPPLREDDLVEIQNGEVNPSETIIHLESTVEGISEVRPAASLTPATPSYTAPSYSATAALSRIEMTAKPIKDPLIGHLMVVFNFINSAIENIDSALLIVCDEWDRILDKPRKNDVKEFFSELLYHLNEPKNFHYMTVLTARTDGESYTLGGSLYNQFRTKLLLEPLSESVCRKLVRGPLKDMGVGLDEEVNGRVYALSQGNPFWHLKAMHYMRERVESNRLKHIGMDFFNKLGMEDIRKLPELSFTRLKLAFLNDEESLYKVIATLLKQFGEKPFSANQAIREISASQGFTDGYVFEVLRALYRHDLIREVDAPAKRMSDTRLLEDKSRRPDPHYVIQSRFILEFLQDKTRSIETDISTDEKLMYLKKIIPLSVKSGELDREKTMEVLALADAMSKPEIVQFLEDLFADYLKDDKPVVRVTALNNIALIDSQKARDALFKAMRDEDSMVREYAARNLALLSQKSSDSQLAGRIVDTMIQSIDDESEAVRAQVYGTLTKYRWHRDLMNVFVKGMADACESVRLTSIKNLADMESESPFVFNSLLDAMDDEVIEVRRYACIGLQRFPGPEAINAIVQMLQTDQDAGIRALAADSLSRMEDPKAFQALITALRIEASEDVKLAVVRSLGKRRGWQTEEILLEALIGADVESMPVFVWACVRSLGLVGGTERSLNALAELKSRITNPIIINAVDFASRKIHERIEELRQIERQLEEATPVTLAIPTEYEQDVAIPEEEFVQVSQLDELPEEPIQRGDEEVDEIEMEEAELRQVELNPTSSIDLPFEKR